MKFKLQLKYSISQNILYNDDLFHMNFSYSPLIRIRIYGTQIKDYFYAETTHKTYRYIFKLRASRKRYNREQRQLIDMMKGNK